MRVEFLRNSPRSQLHQTDVALLLRWSLRKLFQTLSTHILENPSPRIWCGTKGDSQASYPNRSKSEIWNEELSQGSISRIWVDSIISTHIYIIIIFTPTGRYERSVLPLWRCWNISSDNLMSLGLISKELPAAAVKNHTYTLRYLHLHGVVPRTRNLHSKPCAIDSSRGAI